MSKPLIKVEFTPLFIRFLKHLARKYRNVRSDLQSLLDDLEGGKTPGTQVQGTRYTAYKVRVKNSDVSKGKRGGYRVIYYIKTVDRVILIAIYSKTELVDISPEEIKRMIDDYEQSS
jgi:mRNA-degrading endonuclease RelE of RelBE toxin-antitoxin system